MKALKKYNWKLKLGHHDLKHHKYTIKKRPTAKIPQYKKDKSLVSFNLTTLITCGKIETVVNTVAIKPNKIKFIYPPIKPLISSPNSHSHSYLT